ncbi:DUF4956 domain-containing protein [Humidesulfovibrio sp.]
MNNKVLLERNGIRFTLCVMAAVSAVCALGVNQSVRQMNILQLMQGLPVAVGIGLAVGIAYYGTMRSILPRLSSLHSAELWAGLSWFNLSLLGTWAIVLPLETAQIDFIEGFAYAAGCARLIGAIYVVFGSSLSNRKKFANTFVMLTVTIMLVITVIKVSLALSLGLVGALSIIRFRTAIKEPEELAFLFFTVAVGLGFGAGKMGITLMAFWAVCIGYIVFYKIRSTSQMENAYMVTIYGTQPDLIARTGQFMSENGFPCEFTRLESGASSTHISFLTELDANSACQVLGQRFREQFPENDITIVQARSLF